MGILEIVYEPTCARSLLRNLKYTIHALHAHNTQRFPQICIIVKEFQDN